MQVSKIGFEAFTLLRQNGLILFLTGLAPDAQLRLVLMVMRQSLGPHLMPRTGINRCIGIPCVHTVHLIRFNPAPLDGDPVITPLAQLGEIVLGGDVGVHDDRRLVLALILCGKAVQRVEKRAGFADIARQYTGSAWESALIRGKGQRDQRTIVPLLLGTSELGQPRCRSSGHVRVGQVMENHRAASAEQLALAGKQGVFNGPVVFDQDIAETIELVQFEADPDAPRDPAEDHRQTIQTRDHILKFDAEDYSGLSLNEYHCLRAARAGGNDVAEARLNIDGRMLSVRRFDERDGTRLGFEDLASLNTKIAEDKYSGTIERDLFKRVGEFSGDARKENLGAQFRLCVTNFAIRNGDAHLKNFAILFDDADKGPFTLAPAYDLVTTIAYLEADMMALHYGGSKRWPKPGAVLQLGARATLGRQRAQEIINEAGAGLREALPVMLADFEARGMGEIGRKIAAAWNEGLVKSLGVDPGVIPESGTEPGSTDTANPFSSTANKTDPDTEPK